MPQEPQNLKDILIEYHLKYNELENVDLELQKIWAAAHVDKFLEERLVDTVTKIP